MSPIPARQMRAQVQACATRPRPTERDRARRAHIVESGARIFAAHGRARVTLAEFAVAIGLTQIAIRHQVADLDHLFALTLTKHLDEILAAIGAVPHNRPNLHARRRAEYLRVTRGVANALTPLHFLFLRERFSLPDDELASIEQAWSTIGYMLAGEASDIALLLLDSPALDLDQVEAMLQTHATVTQPHAPTAEAVTTQATTRKARAKPTRAAIHHPSETRASPSKTTIGRPPRPNRQAAPPCGANADNLPPNPQTWLARPPRDPPAPEIPIV